MRALLIQLARDGYEVKIKDGGFTLKDSISLSLSKNYFGIPVAQCQILTGVELDSLEVILSDMKTELDNNGENAQ